MSANPAESPLWLEDLVERADTDGPQPLNLPGRPEMTIVPTSKFRLLNERKPTFKELLMSMNFDGVDLSRDPTPARDLEF